MNPAADTAVLVIDMQNDFCAPGGWTDTVVKKDVSYSPVVAASIAKLVDAARAAGRPVIWVRADYSPDKMPAAMRARAEKMQAPVCCAPGTWGAGWYGVQPAAGESVVTKYCYSGFSGTDLDAQLRSRGISKLVFAGVQTHVCVESTLRDAHSRGYFCIVAEECVASHTPAAHEQTLANVRFLFGEVAPAATISAAWR